MRNPTIQKRKKNTTFDVVIFEFYGKDITKESLKHNNCRFRCLIT